MATNYKSEISKIPIVVRYELLKQVRRFRLYGILLIGSVTTGLAITMGAILLGGAGASSALDFSYVIVDLGQVSLFALIAGVFFSGDSISSEFEQKTGYLMFANPIKRTTLLLGKYLAACIACALVVSMPYLITSLGVLAIFGVLPSELLQSYLFAVLYACSVSALTFVFSSLFKGSMGASVLPFLLLFFVFPIISAVAMFGDFEPFVFLNYGAQIISNILLNPYPPNRQSIPLGAAGINMTLTEYSAGIAEGIIIMVSYLVVSLIISAILVRRRQMA
jgi:ABC-type transport system involved in multi-copper enzyme maturation permease subunit